MLGEGVTGAVLGVDLLRVGRLDERTEFCEVTVIRQRKGRVEAAAVPDSHSTQLGCR
jgi:hypothetical protein